MQSTLIWAKTQFVGFHRWPKAPERTKYLRKIHRHLFIVDVKVTARNDVDRDVEFHDLKMDVDAAIVSELSPAFDFKTKCEWSCEEMATKLFKALADGNGYDVYGVSVSEDGECGALVTP